MSAEMNMPSDQLSGQPESQPQPQLQPQPQPQTQMQPQPQLQSPSQPQPQLQSQAQSLPQSQPRPQPPMQPEPQVTQAPKPSSVSPEVASGSQEHVRVEGCSPAFSDGFSELQEHAKLAYSRVQLMDNTIDILLITFGNKYELDKALEKQCSKFLKSGSGSGSDIKPKSLEEDLMILAGSRQWVKEHLEKLEVCLREKHRNMQVAGPLVDAKKERKEEEKQVWEIKRLAEKIERRAVRREESEEGRKRKEMEMLANVEKQAM